jgi:hypothetical protein
MVSALRASTEGRELGGLEGARRLMEGPAERELMELRDAVDQALGAPPDAKVNRVLVGLWLNAYPGDRDMDAFVDILVSDLTDERFCPVVVAEALKTLRRTAKFRGAVSEVIEACQDARRRWNGKLKLIGDVVEDRRKAEALMSRFAKMASRSG